jgi:glycosyltransferase involved in cell wall biosynthesis
LSINLLRNSKRVESTTRHARHLHVAVVDEEIPYPLNTGKRIRTVSLLKTLATRHNVTLLCRRNADALETDHGYEKLRELGIQLHLVDDASPQRTVQSRGLSFYRRLAFNLFSPNPYVVDTHRSARFARAVAEYNGTHHVDLWHCEWTPLFPVLSRINDRPILVVAHNVESQIWRRYEDTESNFAKRWYIRHQRFKFESFETAVFARAAQVIAVSADDADRIRKDFRVDRVRVVENGVAVNYFRPTDQRRDAATVLFLGSLDWRPNLDAVDQLLEKIMPRVWSAAPETRLVIVGRNPPPGLADRIKGYPQVELHANVPDVRSFLARATVMAVPLRIGSGSRLKILESLATGLPVVSTSVGAEGLEFQPGVHYALADTPEDMAGALVSCICRPKPFLAMARFGREVVLDKYHWDALADKLEQAWLACVES